MENSVWKWKWRKKWKFNIEKLKEIDFIKLKGLFIRPLPTLSYKIYTEKKGMIFSLIKINQTVKN